MEDTDMWISIPAQGLEVTSSPMTQKKFGPWSTTTCMTRSSSWIVWPEVVQVDTMSEAKEFLNERFGVPRSSMKTLPQVLSTAYEHKVIFKGLTEDKEKDNNDKE